MSVQSDARRDAREYAAAKMYYGDGAGVRRKLIDATVTSKVVKDPTYAQAFHKELEKQDMGEHATKARRDRARKDAARAAKKNVKGLATGDLKSVSPTVVVLIVAGTIAHKTGLDKKAYDKSKELIDRAKNWNRRRKNEAQIYKITSLRDRETG